MQLGFANGWRSAITRAIMRRNLDAGPVDSLSHLKRAAGQRYAALRESGLSGEAGKRSWLAFRPVSGTPQLANVAVFRSLMS